MAHRYNHVVCLCMFSCCYVTHHYYIWIFCNAILCYVVSPDLRKKRKKAQRCHHSWRQLMYAVQSYVFPNNSQQIHWYHSVFLPAFKPFLAQLAVQGSVRRGEELLVGMNESLFCRDSWLPVHLGRDGKCSSCHKHSAFLSVSSVTNIDGEKSKEGRERRTKTGMKRKKK